jgi:chemotaxis protein methyltransferase CheR
MAEGLQTGYTRADFQRVQRLIRERAGIALGDSKAQLVYGRLSRRVRALGLKSIGEYLVALEGDRGPEWEAFTNALTTNLTAFFRERHHFEILGRHFDRVARGSRDLKIWCAAASTGEEAWSLAMTAVEHYRSFSPPVMILATDVDTQVLATAEAGIYPGERLDSLTRRQRRLFFRHAGGDCMRVIEPLRELVRFRPLNLLAPAWPIHGPLDAIFCRNVMIYFDRDTQRDVLLRFAPLLRPDGLLFAGHSESLSHSPHLFRSCGQTVFQRADAAA